METFVLEGEVETADSFAEVPGLFKDWKVDGPFELVDDFGEESFRGLKTNIVVGVVNHSYLQNRVSEEIKSEELVIADDLILQKHEVFNPFPVPDESLIAG